MLDTTLAHPLWRAIRFCCRFRCCEAIALEDRACRGSFGMTIDRLWNAIETLTTSSAGNEGVNCLTFSEEDWAMHAYLRAQMASIGFEVVEIPQGIMLGRLNPLSRLGRAVMSGSHINTVHAAGGFGGKEGVGGALEEYSAPADVEQGVSVLLDAGIILAG